MGYVPPPPPPAPPCSQCGGTGYDDSSKSGALCPRGCRPPGWTDAGRLLRDGVARARRRWWQRLLCRIGWHPRPLVLEFHAISCKMCGRSWPDDGGLF